MSTHQDRDRRTDVDVRGSGVLRVGREPGLGGHGRRAHRLPQPRGVPSRRRRLGGRRPGQHPRHLGQRAEGRPDAAGRGHHDRAVRADRWRRHRAGHPRGCSPAARPTVPVRGATAAVPPAALAATVLPSTPGAPGIPGGGPGLLVRTSTGRPAVRHARAGPDRPRARPRGRHRRRRRLPPARAGGAAARRLVVRRPVQQRVVRRGRAGHPAEARGPDDHRAARPPHGRLRDRAGPGARRRRRLGADRAARSAARRSRSWAPRSPCCW